MRTEIIPNFLIETKASEPSILSNSETFPAENTPNLWFTGRIPYLFTLKLKYHFKVGLSGMWAQLRANLPSPSYVVTLKIGEYEISCSP